MRVWKQPSERRVYNYDFTELLAGQTITAILSMTSVARTGVTTLTNVASTFTTTKAQVTWSGGADGISYATTVKVRDSALQEHELDGEIFVSDATFILPTGITSTYLSGESYVERYGFEETQRLTDELRRNTIDGPTVMAAITDAQHFAEGYLATRYTLPISAPPELLRGIVADLARERLHKTKPTPTVSAAADRARSLLKDLSAGRASLLVATVEVGATGNNDKTSWSVRYEAPVFNVEKLARY